MKFAFYGRVSTEDQQDPTSSRDWQLARSQALIEPHGGAVVAEFFDIGQSRSLPWKRRPESARLLEALADPARGFAGVVIGEPARAFYGNQFGLTFPVFVHYGVELWVPEVGGRVDPGSDAHDLVMSLYGGMSKGERNRIKVRVRSAMSAQAVHGRFLGGRPPYGYRLADAGPHPNPGKAATGVRVHRLEPDPVTAPVVRRIFEEYIGGQGLYSVAEGLTRDGIPSPSAYDPARNRHRASSHGAWGKVTVQTILKNPRYTGHQVWNRQRRDEVLLDVEDVALGHETKMRWNSSADWIWSSENAHEPLVSPELFARAQAIALAGARRPLESKRRASPRRYLLSGKLVCGVCQRRMQGSWNHEAVHYRCRFPSEYALANRIEHPKTVYVREALIVPALDGWLARVFAPRNIEATIARLASVADGIEDGQPAKAEAARRRLADCDRRLVKYRAAIDAGADPTVVATWIRDAQSERLSAERELARSQPADILGPKEIRALIRRVGDPVRMLAKADDPAAKAQLYHDLDVRLEYRPAERSVAVEVPLVACATDCVGGGT